MKKEVDVAVDLLIAYIQRFGSMKDEESNDFRARLQQTLLKRYEGHWYPGSFNIDTFDQISMIHLSPL
jgi:hypothetical protein